MKKILLTFMLMFPVAAFANDALRIAWGGGMMNHCGTHNMGNACIGKNNRARDNCANVSFDGYIGEAGDRNLRASCSTDHVGMLMLAAYDTPDENCATFVPVQLEGFRAGKKCGDWRIPRIVKHGGSTFSVKLCKTPQGSPYCDVAPLKRDNFNGFVFNGSDCSTWWGSGFRFDTGQTGACTNDGGGAGTGHIMFLGLSEWLSSGHGAWVQQFVYRSQDMSGCRTGLAVYPAQNSRKILACKEGFIPNANNTDCVDDCVNQVCKLDANPLLCIQKSQMCTGWNADNFKESEHVMVPGAECNQFRCKTEGHAFAADGKTCGPCLSQTNWRNGIASDTGKCVHCTDVNKFDQATNVCVPAKRLDHQSMFYGPGGLGIDFKNQCWWRTDFECCILGKTRNQTTQKCD